MIVSAGVPTTRTTSRRVLGDRVGSVSAGLQIKVLDPKPGAVDLYIKRLNGRMIRLTLPR